MQALGIDLGLRTGAVMRVQTWQGESGPARLHDYQPIWANTLGKRSRAERRRNPRREERDPLSIAFVGKEMLRAIDEKVPAKLLPGMAVGIDWSFYEGYMGNRRIASEKAFLAGFLYRGLLERGMVPIIIPPSVVRGKLGLAKTASKTLVHEALLPRMMEGLSTVLLSDHERDAMILAYLAASAKEDAWSSRSHD